MPDRSDAPLPLDAPLPEAFADLARTVARAPAFAAALIVLILALAVGAHVRNNVWRDAGDLWFDIANKVYASRIVDPASGKEAPRSGRGRIYNNIGLYLYDEGRILLRARMDLRESALAYDRLEKIKAPTADERRSLADAEQRMRRHYGEVLDATDRVRAHIPDEFRPACHAAGVDGDKPTWDPFLPSKLCLEKALYHLPSYHPARLNIGLVYKLSTLLAWGDVAERTRLLRRAEEEFRLAWVFIPGYTKALRYHADALLLLGDYAEARWIALEALRNPNPAEGAEESLDAIVTIVKASIRMGDLKVADAWLALARRIAPDPFALRDLETERADAGATGTSPARGATR